MRAIRKLGSRCDDAHLDGQEMAERVAILPHSLPVILV